jgi:RND family efflux transporter MFP subunit
MKKRAVIIGIVLVVIALITIRLIANKSNIDEKKTSKKDNSTTSVNVKPVLRQEQNSSLALTGITAAKQEVLLQAQTGGQILAINFKLGDYVKKGQLLVEIDDRLQSLALENTKINLSKLEDEYNKTKVLFSGKAITENKVRDARIDYETAKVAVEQAQKQLSFTKIAATQSGYVVSKFIERGSSIAVGAQIVSIVDIAQLKVTLNVAEKDIYSIKLGQNTKITSSVFPGVEYSGKVSFVSQQGNSMHNYPIEILLVNQSSHQLKAGTFVNVEFNFPADHSSLLIPRESLVGSIKDAQVYIVENNIAHLKSVTIGRDLGNNLEVLNGLNEGTNVITTGQINISDGSPVTIIK